MYQLVYKNLFYSFNMYRNRAMIKFDQMPPITWRAAETQFAILFGERFTDSVGGCSEICHLITRLTQLQRTYNLNPING